MQRKSHSDTRFNTFLIGYSSNLSPMPIDMYQQGHTSKYNMQQSLLVQMQFAYNTFKYI